MLIDCLTKRAKNGKTYVHCEDICKNIGLIPFCPLAVSEGVASVKGKRLFNRFFVLSTGPEGDAADDTFSTGCSAHLAEILTARHGILMKTPHILIMNGPNLNALGIRQPDMYGTQSLQDIPDLVKSFVSTQVRLSFFQSNHEGALIDRLEAAYHANHEGGAQSIDGIVFNAGAYTHTSLAIADCLAWIGIACVEVHVSNIWARDEPIRQQSYMGKHVIGVIAGFGLASYALGVQALVQHIYGERR